MGRLSKEEQAVLVKSAQLGDVSAFQKLVEGLSPFVKYVENTILNGYEANGTELKDVSKENWWSGFLMHTIWVNKMRGAEL